MKFCAACLVKPEGIAGHRDLRLDVFASGGGGTNAFICEACRASWRRSYVGGGAFEWQLVDTTVNN